MEIKSFFLLFHIYRFSKHRNNNERHKILNDGGGGESVVTGVSYCWERDVIHFV